MLRGGGGGGETPHVSRDMPPGEKTTPHATRGESKGGGGVKGHATQ